MEIASVYQDADRIQVEQPSPEGLRDLAPSGTLRVAINDGNPVLAEKAIRFTPLER